MRSASVALGLAVVVLALAGCAPTVPLSPAADAINPACARVIVHLPATVAELPARETNAQGTGAWGTPAMVILRCGVPVPAPTSALPCVTVDGVDWLRDDSKDPDFVFTTYGRTPAIEVIVDSDGDPQVPDDGVSGLTALTDLSFAVSSISPTARCISPDGTAG